MTGVGDGVERELAEGLVVTGTSDGVDEKLAEVLCETWEGGGMAMRELGIVFLGRVGTAQL